MPSFFNAIFLSRKLPQSMNNFSSSLLRLLELFLRLRDRQKHLKLAKTHYSLNGVHFEKVLTLFVANGKQESLWSRRGGNCVLNKDNEAPLKFMF